MPRAARVLFVGLDCVPPRLALDRWRDHLPVLSSLAARGASGPLRSCTPPITIPAWACMTSGRDPGELGIYGFRDRIAGSRGMRVVTATDLAHDRIWDVASQAGLTSAALFVPPSYPARALRGVSAGCMLTPGPDAAHTHPPELADELRARFGPHQPDVQEPDDGDADALLDALHESAAYRWDVAEHLLRTREPQLLAMVEIGPDRMHHALWPRLDPSDPRHDPSTSLEREARDFYAYLDARLGRLVELAGPGTAVIVASDHGARPLLGGVRVNEHLRREGLLVLQNEVTTPTRLADAQVDWSRTRAWAEGGYHARVFLNTRERFDDAPLDAREADTLRDRLADGLVALAPRTRIVDPRTTYRALRGRPPDLMAFFGDLDLRALGEVGGDVHASPGEVERAPGRGGCNHDWDGMLVVSGEGVQARASIEGAQIQDAGSTALSLLGVTPPADWLGVDRSLGSAAR